AKNLVHILSHALGTVAEARPRCVRKQRPGVGELAVVKRPRQAVAEQELEYTLARARDLNATAHDSFSAPARDFGYCAVDILRRVALLGHAEHSMSGHYASAHVGRLLKLANLVLHRAETRTVLRVANG
ncbi:MAG TPA: hypothetical protein VH109_09865, partial [Steroidobacteraceae bacterium]|nr:hypothetical protein [Steroidobacteraceae bacterium]